MKKVLLVFLCVVLALGSANAQNVSGNCYRGFVDAGYTIGTGNYDFGRIEVNTSHGFQINPYVYVGGGAGLHFMSSYETANMNIPLDIREAKVDVPIFANIRGNFSKGKFAPFVDLKGGTFVTNNGGLYVSGSVGLRVATNEKQALNFSVGFSIEKLEFMTFSRFIGTSLDYTRSPRKYQAEGISLRVGYEF